MKDQAKLKDIWTLSTGARTKKPAKERFRNFVKHVYPGIIMEIGKDGIDAKVEFYFYDIKSSRGSNLLSRVQYIKSKEYYEDLEKRGINRVSKDGTLVTGFRYDGSRIEEPQFTRTITGPSDLVYSLASRQASQISLSDERRFNHRWNRTLLNLLNKPSPNKTMINLGIVPTKYDSGLYNIKSTGELLREKIRNANLESKGGVAQLAKDAGINESTIHRHLAGYVEITRDAAFKYAKVLGCDPSELIFNSLDIPVWGKTDTQDLTGQGDYSVLPSEIIGLQKEEYVSCPREIYRPDVKAI